MTQHGFLYVFEGPDSVGKTEISRLFAGFLRASGRACEEFAFPGNDVGTLGQVIYRIHHRPNEFGIKSLTPTSLQALHIAAHIDAVESRVLPALRSGKHVVLDRFWWSTWVYGVVNGVAKKSLESMIELERLIWNGVNPTALVLVQRSNPLRLEPAETWDQLRREYTSIADAEQTKYRVVRLSNEGGAKDALAELVKSIAENSMTASPLRASRMGKAANRSLGASSPMVFSALSPAKTTVVYDTYWRFAAERQAIFHRRAAGEPPPWTSDPVLLAHKFTNAYRASDRVSQYLIRHVAYCGDQSPAELFFRIVLFKFFNRIDTWELLSKELGEISFSAFRFERYDRILTQASAHGRGIYSAAYIMPSGRSVFGFSRKHRTHLRLLEMMMRDELPLKLKDANSMRESFELLRTYPTIGDFLGYQYATDLNYSVLTDFSEMDFVVPGPGAKDGIKKCFSDLGGLSEADIIRVVADRQETEFKRLGIRFQDLWGRRLQLIDCQNLFCEVDKYARVKHPNVKGLSGRTRIKQRFSPNLTPINLWFPPKWGLNDHLSQRSKHVPGIPRQEC